MDKSSDEDKLPEQWKAIIMPLLKPNKDLHSPQLYRPISLTSAIYKTMEKMVIISAKKIIDYQIPNQVSELKIYKDQLTRLKSVI